MTSPTAPLENILQNSIENLLAAEKQIQEKDGHKESTDTSLETFQKDIIAVAKKLAFECTKICISFTKPPLPTACETSSMLSAVEGTVVCLVAVWYKLPANTGITLKEEVRYAVVYAIQSTRQLLKIIKDEGGEAVEFKYRQSTGIVWQGCNKIEKCSENNKAAVLKGLQEQSTMVNDAFTEISEAMEGDGSGWNSLGIDSEDEEEEEEEKWSNEDKDLITPAVHLVKAAKILFKRVMAAVERGGLCETVSQVEELDQLYQDCKQVSAIVDVLILELYPPLNVPNVQDQSQLLASQIGASLKTATKSHVTGEEDQPHLEFLQKAVEHNLNSLKEKLSQR
ncbi:hypothetical protein Pcinc_030341 [Petrolisthes cinctipes]|uniref:Cyclin-D1-binding protein 1 n=1 Tax=Petrolisthes cinctipes TaxID=88211 RepID=A0AAE1EYC2_PETCI|nr:hypothetical protein Pcinc_030341 [Petrolisthes cinctipes]